MKSLWMLLFILVLVSSAPASDEVRIGTLPNGDDYLPSKVVIVNEYDNPEYVTGQTLSGMAFTGVESVDLLCERIGVVSVEPLYPGILKNPVLKRGISRMYIFTLEDGLDAMDYLAEFTADSHIDYAEPYIIPKLFYIPNDPRISDQWHLSKTRAYEGWDIVRGDTTRRSVIGIVDSGVYYTHPDLAANIWINPGEDVNQNGIYDAPDSNGVDDDSNGYVDDLVGWDLGTNDNNPVENRPTHGTAVAGCAAEVADNGILGAGIGYSARIMCVKVTDVQGLMIASYQGIAYAADQGANIINCSWAWLMYLQSGQELINMLHSIGVLVVAAAGNDNDTIRCYPAAYNHVMAVAATDSLDHLMVPARRGEWIDICAPGVSISTTWGQSTFAVLAGSSFSSPMVSGFTALVRARYPDFDDSLTQACIKLAADTIDHLNPDYGGMPCAGRLNCANWVLTSIDDNRLIPQAFSLSQNYPNPFNAQTTIRYNLPNASEVRLEVYDLLGRRVATLVDGRQEAGEHAVTWDAEDVPSGVYFYRFVSNDRTETRRCVLLK